MSNQLIGIGLRHSHLEQFVSTKPNVGWVEVHSENYLSLGGPDFDILLEIRTDYPISLHGIGMSLGSADGLDNDHLNQVSALINALDPFLVSDHLSWSGTDNIFLPDLLPTPFNDESLQIFINNISRAQDKFKRQLLVENPSTYFEFNNSTYSEAEFLNILAKRTGAGIILDVNNVYISGLNNGWSPKQYINDINFNYVKEIHVSGHFVKKLSDTESLYIDSHDTNVCDEVWNLYKQTLQLGKVPVLIEWDTNIPKLEVLLQEVHKAKLCMEAVEEEVHA